MNFGARGQMKYFHLSVIENEIIVSHPGSDVLQTFLKVSDHVISGLFLKIF